jgi:hypothetical protein
LGIGTVCKERPAGFDLEFAVLRATEREAGSAFERM